MRAGQKRYVFLPEPLRRLKRVVFRINDSAMSAFTPIDRLFDPANGIFTPATAARLLGLRPTEEEIARLEYLAERANEGRLTVEEQEEYESRIRLGKFLSMMQLKAKLLVRADGGL